MARNASTDNSKLFRTIVEYTYANGTKYTHAYGPYTTRGPAARMLTQELKGYRNGVVTGYVEETAVDWRDPAATEFRPWPKTKRLFRNIVVTEKLDGTNAAIHVNEAGVAVAAQSRNRLIFPGADNYGFAGWVHNNAAELGELLGPGVHFGEFWGKGIQRNYGLSERRFSLFNTDRYRHVSGDVSGVLVNAVPILYEGVFSEYEITLALSMLHDGGSYAAPGFSNPEGICVYHTQTRNVFKVTLDNNDAGKWEAA